MDFCAEEGDDVYAPNDGIVSVIGGQDERFPIFGTCVAISHGCGISSFMMHLEDAYVREGERVSSGDVIATVGQSGRATAPHLHWSLFLHGRCVDPFSFVAGEAGL